METMASVRKKGRYEAHDLLDEFLLNQVAKHVWTTQSYVPLPRIWACLKLEYE